MVKRIVHAGLVVLLFGLGLYGSAHIMDVQRERGDVNGDGAIDVLDAVRAVHIVLGTSPPPSGEELWAADCNGDGEANVLDVLGIVNVVLGIGMCVSSCEELDCDDGNPCTEDYCDSLLVQCRYEPLEDGTPCDDGDFYTENDMCVDGVCQGSPRDSLTIQDTVITWFKDNGINIESTDPNTGYDELSALNEIVGNARIVALGEASHGTKECYTMKHRIFKYLVEEKGFRYIGMEGSLPEIQHVNNYILTGIGDPFELLSRVPTWWIDTQEVLDMIEWMRSYNTGVSEVDKIQLFGLDIQSPGGAVSNILSYLATVDAAACQIADSLFEVYKPFLGDYDDNGFDYSQMQEKYDIQTSYYYLQEYEKAICRNNLQQVYDLLMDHKSEYVGLSSEEEFARALRNAINVQQSEQRYGYVQPYHGHGHYRDYYMAENTKWILNHYGTGSKFVLWASNSHVSYGPEKIGNYLREIYGNEIFVIGFSLYTGTFTVMIPSDDPDAVFWCTNPLPYELPTFENSVNYLMHLAEFPDFFIDLRPLKGNPDSNVSEFLNRAPYFLTLGTQFDPDNVLSGFYEWILPERFDAVIHLDETEATDLIIF